MKKAQFKFNSGMGALLCSKCSKIIRQGSDMTKKDRLAMHGWVKMKAQYCNDCKKTKKQIS